MVYGSLLSGSPVLLKSKRFVFVTLLVRENEGRGRTKSVLKTNLFDFNPTGEPASRLGICIYWYFVLFLLHSFDA